MILHNALGDRQAETRAVGATGEERFKNSRPDGLRDTRAGVSEINLGHGVVGAGGLRAGHRELAALGHRMERIESEVEYDLLQLALVSVHPQRARGGGVVQLDARLGQLGAQQDEGVVEDFGQRPVRMQCTRCPGEGEHAGNDAFELFDFFRDDLQVAPPRVIGREIDAQGAVQELDDSERIPDLVGDLGGQQTESNEGFVFAPHLLGLEDPGVEPGILERHRREAGEGG